MKGMGMQLKKDLSTQENTEFWGHATECSKKVKSWPEWKKECLDNLFLKYSYTEEEDD
jgi:hypothetical protein